MLYTVKFTYQTILDASSSSDAHRQICKSMRENPGTFISRIEQGGGEKKKDSLVKQLIHGP